eukprot:CAMPEP_0194395436 /NCGR_PEP_ID=MMETSP0174-20130528/124424_1 /TAXON_ID=216777 /ORGANISM="Proboscia alata, Strain PI-D3" /LENGTH=217 /DNA_ID=CAMNT_0039191375 /DNA_START=427 /DNA_END=1080 /DNA_ORIENTATION=+
MTMNQCFDEIVNGCHGQHGIPWLYPNIVSAFREIHKAGIKGVAAHVFDLEQGTRIENQECVVRLYSIEVWNAQTGELVGGELGYTVGKIYTSLSGFACEDSAGSVQLAALGVALKNCGFELWDLGMYMEYKTRLGAKCVERDVFVDEVNQNKLRNDTYLFCDENIQDWKKEKNCKDIIDKIPQSSQSVAINKKDSKQSSIKNSKDKKDKKQRRLSGG